MAEFTDDAAAALDRIVDPMAARNKTGVHPIVSRDWTILFLEELAQSDGERSEAPVIADHQAATAGGARAGYGSQFLVVPAQRFFAEDVFTVFQGGERLRSVEIMARGDYDGIYAFALEDLVRVGGAGGKGKLVGSVARLQSRCGTDRHQFGAGSGFDRRQKRAGREGTGAYHADADRGVSGANFGFANGSSRFWRSRLGVCQNYTKEGLAGLSGDQVI